MPSYRPGHMMFSQEKWFTGYNSGKENGCHLKLGKQKDLDLSNQVGQMVFHTKIFHKAVNF